jgi:hypothetical protein
MAFVKATGGRFGMDAELAAKRLAHFDTARAALAINWLCELSKTPKFSVEQMWARLTGLALKALQRSPGITKEHGFEDSRRLVMQNIAHIQPKVVHNKIRRKSHAFENSKGTKNFCIKIQENASRAQY